MKKQLKEQMDVLLKGEWQVALYGLHDMCKVATEPVRTRLNYFIELIDNGTDISSTYYAMNELYNELEDENKVIQLTQQNEDGSVTRRIPESQVPKDILIAAKTGVEHHSMTSLQGGNKMRTKKNPRELYTSAKSNPAATAGAIAGRLYEDGVAEIVAIGAASINNAVKAIAIARGYVAPHGVDIVCIPSFDREEVEGKGERVSIRFTIEPKQ